MCRTERMVLMAWTGWTPAEKMQWRRVVKPAVLARDGGRCMVRVPGEWKVVVGTGDDRVVEWRRCAGVATTVHHTLGSHTKLNMQYLVASCVPCNLKIGDPRKKGVVSDGDADW